MAFTRVTVAATGAVFVVFAAMVHPAGVHGVLRLVLSVFVTFLKLGMTV
jgi:hypothetical protein